MKLDNRRNLKDYTLAMKSHLLTQCLVALSLLAFSINSSADQWYHVELIVFEQLDTITDEQWPKMGEQEIIELTPQTASVLIQPTETESLLSQVSRLERSPSYQVHYHQAWQQPIMKKRHAQAVAITSEDEMVNGSIRLYKSTYLHAGLDLWLNENTSDITSWSDISPEGEVIDFPRNPNLKESRRIRSKKLYFFDHPKLGALLQLTPIDTPEKIQAKEESLESFSLPTEAVPTAAE